MSLADEVPEHVSAMASVQSAMACHRAGDLPGAERLYRVALQHDGQDPTALALLGAICAGSGRAAEAVCLLRRAVRLRPEWAEGHEQLGLAMMAAGDEEAGIEALERATCLGPHLPSTFYNLANALRDRGERQASVLPYLRALSVAPDFVEALVNLACVLIDLKRAAEAVPHLRRAVALRPGDPVPLRNLGIALRDAGEWGAAEEAFRAVAAITPDDASVWTDLGGLLRDQRRTDEADTCFRRACDLRPGFAPHHLNLGLVREDRGEFEAALECYDAAYRLDPNYAEARLNRAIVRLTLGDWPAAWPAEGWNALVGGDQRPAPAQPRWDGRALSGTILVRAEQGYGDTIQFMRYLPMVRERCGRVVFECQPGLMDLVGGCGLADEVVSMRVDGRIDAEFDEHTELMTLPAIFGTSRANVPAAVPYVRVPRERLEAWRAPMGEAGATRVALVWAGNPKHRNDRNRSMRLEQLAPLALAPGVRFYSLQKGAAAEQLTTAGRDMHIADLGPDLQDYIDTAAALRHMDLVITVDTSVAHLAGALGIPVWMLIPRVPDWRWLLGRDDTPWYPTMRIFRQKLQGEWGPVVDDVACELASRMLARAA